MSIVAYDGSFTMIGRPLMVMPFSSAASRAGHRHAIVIWAVAGNVDDAPQPAIGILFEQRRRQRSEAFVFLRRPRNASDDRAHFFPLTKSEAPLFRCLSYLVLQVAGLIIAAEVAQRRLVQLQQNFA